MKEAEKMKTTLSALGLALAIGLLLQGLASGADLAKGKATYDQYCAGCHGPSGKGDGPAAASLNPKPRNFSDKAYAQSLKDDYLLQIIKNGGAAVKKSPIMPAMGQTLKADQIRDVIGYLRSLAK